MLLEMPQKALIGRSHLTELSGCMISHIRNAIVGPLGIACNAH